jgi:hypothetical protein
MKSLRQQLINLNMDLFSQSTTAIVYNIQVNGNVKRMYLSKADKEMGMKSVYYYDITVQSTVTNDSCSKYISNVCEPLFFAFIREHQRINPKQKIMAYGKVLTINVPDFQIGRHIIANKIKFFADCDDLYDLLTTCELITKKISMLANNVNI